MPPIFNSVLSVRENHEAPLVKLPRGFEPEIFGPGTGPA
jgi:hypothetical protein